MRGTCPTCMGVFTRETKRGAKPVFCSPKCKFESHFEKTKNKCWVWDSPRNANGYGVFGNANKRNTLAHRFAYELFVGKIPSGLFVLHHCDNPPCVNPAHLFVGTAKDNAKDCVQKGRNSPPPLQRGKENIFSKNAVKRLGEKHHSAKLTIAIVGEILSSTEKAGVLGRRFGVNRQVIWMIRTGRIWKDVRRPPGMPVRPRGQ